MEMQQRMDQEKREGGEEATEKGLCRAEHYEEEEALVCAFPASRAAFIRKFRVPEMFFEPLSPPLVYQFVPRAVSNP